MGDPTTSNSCIQWSRASPVVGELRCLPAGLLRGRRRSWSPRRRLQALLKRFHQINHRRAFRLGLHRNLPTLLLLLDQPLDVLAIRVMKLPGF